MFDSFAFIPGMQNEEVFPLGRFLPPLPQGVLSSWLQENVPPGSWIIDPFCASPALIVEAAQAGYCVLTAANNPIERFILELFCQPPAVDELQSALADLAVLPKGNERIEAYIRSLYHTLCPQCGETIEAQAFIWDRQTMKPVSRMLNCPVCQNRGEYPATQADQENAARHSAKGLHWFRALERVAPINDPDRQHAQEAMATYLPRSVDALFTLVNRLDHFSFDRQRLIATLLLPVFDQSNTLWAHPPARFRPKQLSQPVKFREINIWQTLEDTIDTWARLLDGHSQDSLRVPILKFPDLAPSSGGVTVFAGRLKDLSAGLLQPENKDLLNSLDLKAVYAAIPRPNQAYWTLSTLWAGWLWGSEMTESFKSVLRRRRYDWSWHSTALTSAFNSLAAMLKADTPFLGLSGEGEPGLVSACLLAGAEADFSLQGLASRQESRQLQIHWKRSKMPATHLAYLPNQFQEMVARTGNHSMHQYLSQRGEPASYAQLHTVMLSQIVKSPDFQLPEEVTSGELLSMVQSSLQHTTMQDPSLLHIGGGERSVESGRWFFRPEENGFQRQMKAQLSLADRVEMEFVRYLIEHPGCSTHEVDQALCKKFPGLWTPETGLINACLLSYGETTTGVKTGWVIREQDTPEMRHTDLRELDRLLEQSGTSADFLVKRTPPLGTTQRPAILWQNMSAETDYLFFITASAVISPVIAQVNAYLESHSEHKSQLKILVTPGSRSNLIQYKLEQNLYLKNAIEGQWRFLKFRSLRRLAESDQLDAASLEIFLSQDPVEKTDPQIPLF